MIESNIYTATASKIKDETAITAMTRFRLPLRLQNSARAVIPAHIRQKMTAADHNSN